MKKVTFVPGKYSQLKLEKGSRFFVETLPQKIRVKKMFIGLIPTKTIWEVDFPFYIRTAIEAWKLSKEILDLVLETVENSTTNEEFISQLNKNATPLLKDYIEKNKTEAYKIGIDKLGSYAAKKYMATSPIVQDALGIPNELMDIIGDYGDVLENLSKEGSNMLRPISKLPHPKEKIESALKTALQITKDEEMKKNMQAALIFLNDFIPDEDIPSDPMENLMEWSKRQN